MHFRRDSDIIVTLNKRSNVTKNVFSNLILAKASRDKCCNQASYTTSHSEPEALDVLTDHHEEKTL